MKYIHQECLEFWLEHSNKQSCDICHAKFHFNIIYNEKVPSTIPFRYIFAQFITYFIKYQYIAVKFLLAGLAILETFYAVSIIDMLINTLLGIPVPESFQDSLLPSSLTQFSDRFANGAIIAVIYALLTIGIVLIQNSFVMDDGFQKIIDKKIGKLDTRAKKLLDMINQHRQQEAQRNAREETLTFELARSYAQSGILDPQAPLTIDQLRSMRDFDLENVSTIASPVVHQMVPAIIAFNPDIDFDNIFKVEELKRIDTHIRTKLIERSLPPIQDGPRLAEIMQQLGINDLDNEVVNDPNDDESTDDEDETVDQQPTAEEFMQFENLIRNNAPVIDLNNPANNAPNLAPPLRAGRIPQQQQPVPPPPAPAADNHDAGFFGNKKDITYIIQIAALANIASLALLVLHKFFPSAITSVCVPFVAKLISPYRKLYPLIHSKLHHLKINTINFPSRAEIELHISTLPLPVSLTINFIKRNITNPLISAVTNTIANTPTDSLFERTFVQITGIVIIITFMRVIMWKMEQSCSQQHPLTGRYRLVYISLLQFVSVFKVLVLIIIEWVFFPIFCGLQIEFALVPIFNSNLYTYQLEPQLFTHPLLAIVLKWFIGTFFMYHFVSFVTMIRSKILRPGVMFFIRPSDDPNVQIVHDALMRHFMLRLSRIALSAAVYSIYMNIQFTVVSWSVRLLLSPLEILPFHNNIIDRYAFAGLFILSKFMEPFFINYWKQSFIKCCHFCSLSHFMLNKDIPNERGYIVYKSLLSRLNHLFHPYDLKYIPDYENPVHPSSTTEYFTTHPNAAVCFVTNGNYVRAPDNDHVSRKFVRTLFVPVTKTDQLLAPIPEIPDDEAYYNPYNDVDPMDVDSYTIVYRPTHFKTRLTALFFMLWSLSLLFTAGLYSANVFIGKLFLNITHISQLFGLPTQFYSVDLYSLLITFAVLSQSPQIITIVRNGHNNIFIIAKLIISHIHTQITRLRDRPFVFFMLHRAETFIHIIAFLHALNYALGTYIITNNLLMLTIGFLSAIVCIIASIKNDRPSKKRFTFASMIILISRFISSKISPQIHPSQEVITALELCSSMESMIEISHANNLSPDTYITTRIVSMVFPAPIPVLFKKLQFAEYQSIEASVYFVIWAAVATWIGVRYAARGWVTFREKTKERYFANNKILANIDDEEIED